MNKYHMARFDPEDHELRPLQQRTITAESEDDAYLMIGEPFDRTYWAVVETEGTPQ